MHYRPRKQGRFIILCRFPIGWVDEEQRKTNAHTQIYIYIYIYIHTYILYIDRYIDNIHCAFGVNISEIFSFFSTSTQSCLTETLRYPQEPYQDYQNCLYLYMCCFCIPFSCVPCAISCTMECSWTLCIHFFCKSSLSSFCVLNSIAHQS